MQGGQMKTYREWRRLNRIWWGAGIFVLFLFLAGIGMNAYRIEMHDRMLFGILVENKIAEEQMQNIVAQLTEADAKWTNGKKEAMEKRGEIYLEQSGYAKTRGIIRNENLREKLWWGIVVWIFMCAGGFLLLYSWRKRIESGVQSFTEGIERESEERKHSEEKREQIWEEDSLFSELEVQIGMLEDRRDWQIACARKEKEGMGELLENMAHQLKTPVSVTQLYLEALLRKETDTVKRQKLEVCVGRMEELTELITALLKEGKMQAGKIQMEK
jgi:signal transduction histidine kinase